jgi:hypothetical protein
VIFLNQGLFEFNILKKPLQRLLRGKSAQRIDDTNSSNKKGFAERRAKIEEMRRKEQAFRRRSFGKMTRNIEVFHQKQQMASNSIHGSTTSSVRSSAPTSIRNTG